MRPDNDELVRALQDRFLAESAEYAFVYFDPDGRIAGWQGAAELIFGYTAEEVIGVPGKLLFTPEDLSAGLDRHELAVAGKDSRSEDDRWHVRKDGARIWIHGSVQAVRDAHGELLGYVKVLRDRTDAREQVEGLERELAQSRQRWEEARRMLRTLGHEMRNPLSPLANCAHILDRKPGDDAVAKVAGIIRTQVGALTRLAEDLLDVVRAERGQLVSHREPVDMRVLLQEQVTASAATAANRGVRLESIVPDAPMWTEVDRGRFAQVLQNLVGNAVKYTGEGGHVWCKLTREGQEVVLRVQDTGIGITADELPRIFDLFTRGTQASELEPGGLGVGLAIAQQVLQAHGGSIQARSSGSGKGAEFTLRIPASREPAAPVPG